MSATRDPDRILRAWLDQMPSEAPDRAIDAVLLATTAAPQVRAWPSVGRWRLNPMNRLSVFAAMAVLVLALAGGAMLLTGGRNGPAAPSAVPTATPVATLAAGVTPETIRANWIANGTPGDTTSFTTLNVTQSAVAVVTNGVLSGIGQPVAGASDELTLVAPATAPGCQAGDVGRYRYALQADGSLPNSDGTLLSFTAVSDQCAARQSILARTWVRAVGDLYKGGRFVATQFSPMFLVTLPDEPYGITFDSKDALMIEPSGAAPVWNAFVATRNPWGLTQPCTDSGGPKLPVDPTIDAFVAYLDALPGFTVQQKPVKLGTLDAVHLTIPTTKTADCQNRGANSGRVVEWTNSDPSFTGTWVLGQGDTDSMYLVESNGSLFVFQWLGVDMTEAKELEVLSTIRIVDALPQ